MDNKELYGYGLKDRTKLKGIRGVLTIIFSWNIMSFMSDIASYSKISHVKFACITTRDLTLPETYFDTARLGYMISLFFTIVMIFAFLKKLKVYKYLEIINLASKTIFLSILCYILGDINYVFSELTGILPMSILFSLCSIIYLFNSYRVKNTFVN